MDPADPVETASGPPLCTQRSPRTTRTTSPDTVGKQPGHEAKRRVSDLSSRLAFPYTAAAPPPPAPQSAPLPVYPKPHPVYCRIRPVLKPRQSVEFSDTSTVLMADRNAPGAKEDEQRQTYYTFSRVFGSGASQEDVFEDVAKPLVQDLIHRKNDELSNTDEEINSCVTKLMTYLKVAEAQGENPKRFNSTDVFLMKVGEGRFCDVFTCHDKTTTMEVAVKIFKDTCKKEDIEREVSMLEEISLVDPFSKFTVKFLKQCEHDGRTCLVFEKLEENLKVRSAGYGDFLYNIRSMAIQLFLALDELKANILHADIHPGNIAHVNRREKTYYIKLIDFGMAIKASDAQPGMELQTLECRAPEIFLGLPFTEAIDVWGVGCILAFFYLGSNLFSASSEDQMVERIVELLGQPEDHLLRSGKYTQRYFMEDEAADGPTWRLRNPGKQNNSTDKFNCLDDLVHIRMEKIDDDHDYEDKMAFVDLLKQLLHVDANQRISAHQALKHPFITMDHLINHFVGDI